MCLGAIRKTNQDVLLDRALKEENAFHKHRNLPLVIIRKEKKSNKTKEETKEVK